MYRIPTLCVHAALSETILIQSSYKLILVLAALLELMGPDSSSVKNYT